MKARDVLETEVETLRGFGEPPPPYRAVVSIPGGFEYTGEGNSAETAPRDQTPPERCVQL
jgi:hypothetical protein